MLASPYIESGANQLMVMLPSRAILIFGGKKRFHDAPDGAVIDPKTSKILVKINSTNGYIIDGYECHDEYIFYGNQHCITE